jgi:peptidoglycan hydrolase-like protein with peptidoglycan-binding domain
MKINKFVAICVALLILLGPVGAFADTATTTPNTQIQNMLAQIQALQAQLQTLQGLQTQVQTAQNNITQTLTLIHGLSQGMSGADVTTLQTILAADPSVYPSGLITGFFGAQTAQAVKNFQKKNGLEAVGNVGPKTLAKLNEEISDFGLSKDDDDMATSTATSTISEGDEDHGGHGEDNQIKLCVKVPPGHLIAPGWLKKNGGVMPIVPTCQILPPGIANQIGNNSGITTPATTTPPVLDTTAPIISAVTATSTAMTAVVTWTTNELSTSKLWYGTSLPLLLASSTLVSNNSFVLSHMIPLSALATSTSYSYLVVSVDPSGNIATSSINTLMTLAQ